MIGSESLAHEPLITSVEWLRLSEPVAILHGIRVVIGIGIVEVMISIISSMIYLANADALHNNNTMTKISLVHDEWSTP